MLELLAMLSKTLAKEKSLISFYRKLREQIEIADTINMNKRGDSQALADAWKTIINFLYYFRSSFF